MECKNCLQHFSGGHDYSRHLANCNGNAKQCPYCRSWFMSQGQRDHHVILRHSEGA